MPTLSLIPQLSGSAPATEAARANGETEGREGQSTTGINSGATENTWTRLFQSYLQQNKQSDSGLLKSGSKSDLTKSKDDLDSAATTSIASSTAFNTAAQTVIPAVAASTVISQPVNAVAADVAPSETVAATPSAATANATASPALIPQASNQPALTAPSTATPSNVETPSEPTNGVSNGTQVLAQPVTAMPAIATATPAIATATVVTAQEPILQTKPSAVAPSTKKSDAATRQASNNSGQSNISANTLNTTSASTIAAVATNLPAPAAPIVTQAPVVPGKSSGSISAVVAGSTSSVAAPTTADPAVVTTTPSLTESAQVVNVPASIPSAVLDSISSAQMTIAAGSQGSTATLQPITAQNVTTGSNKTANVKANMERNQVLGDAPVADKEPVAEKEASSDKESFSSNNSKTSTGQSEVGDSTSGQGSSFSTAMNTATASSTSPTTATNTTLVQDSSHEERIAVVNQIAGHIQSMNPSTSANSTMTVTVQPPQWGQVKIEVSLAPQTDGVAKQSITATVTASTTEVQGVLQQHVQDLRSSLASAGVHLDKVDIGVGAVSAMSQSGSSAGHHSGQQGSGQDKNSFQPAWSGASESSGGSSGQQQQAGTGWSSGDDNEFSTSSNITSASSNASASSVEPSAAGGSGNARIDMRA